jgi:hypothetical protein
MRCRPPSMRGVIEADDLSKVVLYITGYRELWGIQCTLVSTKAKSVTLCCGE